MISPEKIAAVRPTDDITTRLDNLAQSLAGEYPPHTLMDLAEAASLISTLRAERDEARNACRAAWDSIGRFPGSVHDRAMSKLERVVQGANFDYADPDLTRAIAAEAQVARQGEAIEMVLDWWHEWRNEPPGPEEAAAFEALETTFFAIPNHSTPSPEDSQL